MKGLPRNQHNWIVLLATISFSPLSRAISQEWEVFVVDPVASGTVNAIDHRRIAGSRYTGDILSRRAAVWDDPLTAVVPRDFQPAGAQVSEIASFKGSRYVGYARISGVDRAAIWDDSSGGYRDIHPSGATTSRVRATIGLLQGGYATRDTIVKRVGRGIGGPSITYVNLGKFPHACTWKQAADSFVDLHPQGRYVLSPLGPLTHEELYEYEYSSISACSFGVLGGYAGSGSVDHAGVWKGSGFIEFWDLNPSGADSSRVTGLGKDYQVGYAVFNGALHAAAWSGDTHSFLDLHPSAYAASGINATTEGIHCGFARSGSDNHAYVWNSQVGEELDLHATLPPSFSSSTATAIWTDGVTTLVGGSGYSTSAGRILALVWKSVSPGGVITFNDTQTSYSITRKDGSTVLFENTPGSAKSITLVSGKGDATKGLKLIFSPAGDLRAMVDSSGMRMFVRETRYTLNFRFSKAGSKRSKVVTIKQRRPPRRGKPGNRRPRSLEEARHERISFKFLSPFRLRLEQFGVNREELANFPIVGKDILEFLDRNMEHVNTIIGRVSFIATRGQAAATREIIQTVKEDALDLTLGDDEAYKIVRPAVDAVVTFKGIYDFFDDAAEALPSVADIIDLSNNLEDAFETMSTVNGWLVDPATGVALSDLLPFMRAAPDGFTLNGNYGNQGEQVFSTTFRSGTGTGEVDSLGVSATVTYGPAGFTATANITLEVDGRIIDNSGSRSVGLVYDYSGSLQWDGTSFAGPVSGPSGNGYLSIVYDPVAGAYYTGMTIPVTYRLDVTENGVFYQQPLQTTIFSPRDSFFLQ